MINPIITLLRSSSPRASGRRRSPGRSGVPGGDAGSGDDPAENPHHASACTAAPAAHACTATDHKNLIKLGVKVECAAGSRAVSFVIFIALCSAVDMIESFVQRV